MGIIDSTSVLGNIRGKWAGTVISSSSTTWYVRNWRTPFVSTTKLQAEMRLFMARLGYAWQSLSASNKAQWNDAAAEPAWQKADWFGNLKNPTGYGLFIRVNFPLILAQKTLQDTPPVASFPVLPDITNATLTRSGTSVSGTAYLADYPPSDVKILITWLSPTATASTWPAKIKRNLDSITTSTHTQQVGFWQTSRLHYGYPTVGQTWTVYITGTTDAGQTSQPIAYVCTCTAP